MPQLCLVQWFFFFCAVQLWTKKPQSDLVCVYVYIESTGMPVWKKQFVYLFEWISNKQKFRCSFFIIRKVFIILTLNSVKFRRNEWFHWHCVWFNAKDVWISRESVSCALMAINFEWSIVETEINWNWSMNNLIRWLRTKSSINAIDKDESAENDKEWK